MYFTSQSRAEICWQGEEIVEAFDLGRDLTIELMSKVKNVVFEGLEATLDDLGLARAHYSIAVRALVVDRAYVICTEQLSDILVTISGLTDRQPSIVFWNLL